MMIYMVCRNRVADFATWKRVFDSHADAHRAAGLELRQVARDLEDPNQVFYAFEIASVERAKGFINAPGAAEAGKASGVLDGEYHFVETTAGYRAITARG
jgi:hypothetical protein